MSSTATLPVNLRPIVSDAAAVARDVDYALSVARGYVSRLEQLGVAIAGRRVLELGPGPSLGTAMTLRCLGARVSVADRFPTSWQAAYHPAFFARLAEVLPHAFPEADTGPIDAVLAAATFAQGPLDIVEAAAEALDGIPDGTFDVVLSNAVFEHVRDVPAAVAHLARVTATGGLHVHQVDFRDHRNFDRPLDYLTLPARHFTHVFDRSHGECGNRWRARQLAAAFEWAGLSVAGMQPNLHAADDYVREMQGTLHGDFATLGEDDLRVLSAQLTLVRSGAAARVPPSELGPPWADAARADRPDVSAPTQKVLLLRSCRPPQFQAAVDWIRRDRPGAAITGMSVPGFSSLMFDAGVDDILEVPGRRFGLWQLCRGALARIRSARYDAIVIPLVDGTVVGAGNLMRVAVGTGIPSIILFGADGPVGEARGATRWLHAITASAAGLLRVLDVPMMLLLLLVAWCTPRPHRTPPGGRQRVLQVISSWGIGGAQAQLAELLNRLPRDQYEVDLLVLGRGDGEFSNCRLARADIRPMYLTTWPLLSAAVLEIAILCRRNRYDVVHTWLFFANFLGAAGARLARAPYIVSGVRNLSLWKRAWNTRWWYRPADALGSRLPDRLTVNADALVADHARWALVPAGGIEVVHNGLDPDLVRAGTSDAHAWLRSLLGVPPDTPIIGTVGRLAPEKHQATFIEIAARAIAARPDVHAVIVGTGPEREALGERARALGIADRVHFLGARSDSRRVIAGLDVFVLTSLSEGFPNVLLEAVFLKTPAVSSDVAGARDVIGPDLLFPAGDSRVGTDRVLRVLDDRAGTHARCAALEAAAARQFTAEHMARRWQDVYTGGRVVPASTRVDATRPAAASRAA